MPLIIQWNSNPLAPDSAGTSLGTDGKNNLIGLVSETAGGTERSEPSSGLFIEHTVAPPSLDVPLGLKPIDEGYEVQDTLLTNRADNSGGLYYCYPRRSYVPQDLDWTKKVPQFKPNVLPRPVSPSTNILPTVESYDIYEQRLPGRRWPFRTDYYGNKSGVQIGVPTIRWPLRDLDFALAVPPIDPAVLFAYTGRTRTPYPFLSVRRGAGTFRRYFLPGIVGYHSFPVFGLSGDAHVLIDRQEGAYTWIMRINRELEGIEDIRWTVTWNQMIGNIQERSVAGGPFRTAVLAQRKRYNFVVRTLDVARNTDFQWFTAESGIGVITPEALPTDLYVYCGLDYATVFFPRLRQLSKFSLGTPIDSMSNVFPHLATGTDQPLPYGTTYDTGSGVPFRELYENGTVTGNQDVPIVHTGYLELKCYNGLEQTPIGTAYFHCDPAQTADYAACWEYRETVWPTGPTT